MKMTKEQYEKIYKRHSGSTSMGKNCLWAFLVGGGICLVGEIIRRLYLKYGFSEQSVSTLVPVTMVFLGVALTAGRVYHKLADKAGAGTLVPITGFANAVSSVALEFKPEGLITGTCVKIFTIAGPVIAIGTSASVLYGVVLWLMGS